MDLQKVGASPYRKQIWVFIILIKPCWEKKNQPHQEPENLAKGQL